MKPVSTHGAGAELATLARALDLGPVGLCRSGDPGPAFDVFETEPRILVTPHVAGGLFGPLTRCIPWATL